MAKRIICVRWKHQTRHKSTQNRYKATLRGQLAPSPACQWQEAMHGRWLIRPKEIIDLRVNAAKQLFLSANCFRVRAHARGSPSGRLDFFDSFCGNGKKNSHKWICLVMKLWSDVVTMWSCDDASAIACSYFEVAALKTLRSLRELYEIIYFLPQVRKAGIKIHK